MREILSRIKLTIIFPFDPLGSKVGGAESFIKGFIKYAPEDFDIDVIGINTRPENIPCRKERIRLGNKEFSFVSLFFEKEENKKTIIPLSLRFTIAFLRSLNLLTPSVLFYNRIEPALLTIYSSHPKIVIVHNDIKKQMSGNEVLWSRTPGLYFAFEKFLFNSIDNVFTVSKNSLAYYLSNFKNSKTKFSFLPTWVDKDIFYPSNIPKIELRQELQTKYKSLNINSKWLLFVGRLQSQKAPKRLINAFNVFCKDNLIPVSLLIVGDGNLRQEAEVYVRELDLQKRVFFMGNLPQSQILKLYNAADVFLLTSDYEGMPMCVLEALGCGLPVVTTDVGEVKTVVKNGISGEVVESSPEKISNAILRILNNPDNYKKGCVRAVEDFTPQKVFSPVYDLIKFLYLNKFGD